MSGGALWKPKARWLSSRILLFTPSAMPLVMRSLSSVDGGQNPPDSGGHAGGLVPDSSPASAALGSRSCRLTIAAFAPE